MRKAEIEGLARQLGRFEREVLSAELQELARFESAQGRDARQAVFSYVYVEIGRLGARLRRAKECSENRHRWPPAGVQLATG